MIRSKVVAMISLQLLLVQGCSAQATPACGAGRLGAYEGAFVAGADTSAVAVTFSERDGELLMFPALWDGPMVLRQVSPDSFLVPAHPRFGVAFRRDSTACVIDAMVYGLGGTGRFHAERDVPAPPLLLLDRAQPMEAARQLIALGPAAVEIGLDWAEQLLQMPLHTSKAKDFLEQLSQGGRPNARLHELLGDAWMALDSRRAATDQYRSALATDASRASAREKLERLDALPTASQSGWRVPFSLDALFAAPRPEELDGIRAEWRTRDLEGSVVNRGNPRRVDVDGTPMDLRLFEHPVRGVRHITAALVPVGAAAGSLPILLEAKGVSWNYFPMTIPDGFTSPEVLGSDRSRVVIVVPLYRGERFVIADDTVASDGAPNDAWDGATDDLLAALHVALTQLPEADTSRICVFGRSRGGTVALLAGIRDPRIDCVVAWAAPTDWFQSMGLGGWTPRELLESGLAQRAAPPADGGQFIDHFLRGRPIGSEGLAAIRTRLIAASPLYFASGLPLTQAHWGLNDGIVPVINGRTFEDRYRASDRPARCLDVRYSRGGHDQDRQRTPRESKAFLLGALFGSVESIESCRPAPRR